MTPGDSGYAFTWIPDRGVEVRVLDFNRIECDRITLSGAMCRDLALFYLSMTTGCSTDDADAGLSDLERVLAESAEHDSGEVG